MYRIFLLDDSYKALKVNPQKTTVEELWELAADKLMLTVNSAPLFFLYGQQGDLELLLYTHQKLVDLEKDWPQFMDRYGRNEKASDPFSLAKIANTLTRSSSQLDSRESTAMFQEEFRVVFRTTSVLMLADELKDTDPGALQLFYIQAVHNIVHSNYPCLVEQAVELGGLQVQLTVGDQNRDVHKPGYLIPSLYKYVPEHLLAAGKLKESEWDLRLLNEHRLHAVTMWFDFVSSSPASACPPPPPPPALCFSGIYLFVFFADRAGTETKPQGKDKKTLMLKYLSIVREFPYYGSTFFKGVYLPSETVFFKQEFEGKVRVGINEQGIHFIDPRKMKFASFAFANIRSWNSDRNKFWFVYEDDGKEQKSSTATTLQKVRGKGRATFMVASGQAELINDLVCDWISEMEGEENMQKRGGNRSK
jgi:hypothetical protein